MNTLSSNSTMNTFVSGTPLDLISSSGLQGFFEEQYFTLAQATDKDLNDDCLVELAPVDPVEDFLSSQTAIECYLEGQVGTYNTLRYGLCSLYMRGDGERVLEIPGIGEIHYINGMNFDELFNFILELEDIE
jgi:hypothetical protein